MLPIATVENPTAIPPTELRRQRERDDVSYSGVRIAWTLFDQVAFLTMLRCLRKHPNRSSRVSGNLERVLRAILLRQCGENPDYCPAVAHLAEDCGLDRRTVQNLLRRAEALNVLEIRERYRDPTHPRATLRTTQTSNRYLLLLPTPDEIGEFTIGRRQPAIGIPAYDLPTGVAIHHPTTDSYFLSLLSSLPPVGWCAGKGGDALAVNILPREFSMLRRDLQLAEVHHSASPSMVE